MRFLKTLVMTIVVLVIMVAGVGFLLPQRVTVERSIVVNSLPGRVFAFARDLGNNPLMRWMPAG